MAVTTPSDIDAESAEATHTPLLVSYYLILGSTILLLVLGLVMVLSSSSVESIAASQSPYGPFLDQLLFAAVGVVLMVIAAHIKVPIWRKLAWAALILGFALQLLVFTPLGYSQNGNRNWIEIGPITIQPSEFLKLALAVWLGAVLSVKRPLLGSWMHSLIPVVPVAGAAIALVIAGHDLGTALVMILLVAGAMFVAGVPLRVFAALGAVAGAGVLALVFSSANRMGRIAAFFGQDCDVSSDCWQTQHGLYALGSGGWFGLGLGASREKWSYLPEAHNDFIFAIIGEELGLIGTLVVLLLYAMLCIGLLQVVLRHRDPFVKITVGAITFWVIGQALINIAVVIGLAPVIGVPLPLVSAGGSALIATLIAIGMVLGMIRTEPEVAASLQALTGQLRGAISVVSLPRRTKNKEKKSSR